MARPELKLNRRDFTAAVAAGAATVGLRDSIALAAKRDDVLLAGAAETVATPAAEGTFLIGPMKRSTGVNDYLYVRALVLAQGEQRIAVVTLDYLGFDFAYTDMLLAAASKAAGIPADNVMLNCSHTHSAPLTAPWGPWKASGSTLSQNASQENRGSRTSRMQRPANSPAALSS